MLLLNLISLSKSNLVNISKYKIIKRYYPGGLSNLLNNRSLIALKSTPLFRAKHLITYRQHILQRQDISKIYLVSIEGSIETTLKSPIPAIVKPPIYRYNPQTIDYHLTNNYIIKKHLPLFEKNGVYIPIINEISPTHGISGSYTLPPIEANALKEGNDFICTKHALVFAKYFMALYGGPKIQNIKDILQRLDYLFSKNNLNPRENNAYSKYYDMDFIPLFQHILSQDTWNLFADRNMITYKNNMEVELKKISLQKHIEIILLENTHHFLKHILIIDNDNPKHIQLLNEYHSMIKTVVKQPSPDGISLLGVGLTNKLIYPVDAKLLKNPEVTLDMLSSHSSLSASIKPKLIVDKFKGQISVQKNKITSQEFNASLNQWSIHFAEAQIKRGSLIYEGLSFTPLIIADAINYSSYPLLDYFNENSLLLENLTQDFKNNIKFNKYYPTMKEYQTLDLYEIILPILIILKKHGLLENYYAMRDILMIKGVDD